MNPGALEALINGIEDGIGIVAGNFTMSNQKGEISYYFNGNKIRVINRKESYKAWATRKIFLRAGSFIVRTEIAKANMFNPKYRRYEDVDVFLKWMRESTVKYIPFDTMNYDVSFAVASKASEGRWDSDYLFHLDFEKGNFWRNCVMGDLLRTAVRNYPSKLDQLKSLYSGFFFYKTVAKYTYAIYNLPSIIMRKLKLKKSE